MPRLFLLDASGYIFRAHYAPMMPDLRTSKGFPTKALYGFTSILLKLLREQKPDMIGIVFDVARKTFRNEKYPDYKANRSDPPEDLVPQFPYFRKIVKAMNLPVLELPNYEADDVIGTIAKKFERKNWEVVVVTGDKDMMQLVDDKIIIYDSMRDKWVGIPEVRERFGVSPSQVPDILGLAGDSSDNIPGISGIGEKTATKLVQEYGSLEKVVENAQKIKGKMGEKILHLGKEALLFKEIATIVTNVPIEYDLKDFKPTEPNASLLRELFEELEFRRFLSELAPQKRLSTKDYHLVTRREDLKILGKALESSQGFAFDTETTSLDIIDAELVGLSFSAEAGKAYYVPVGHRVLTEQLSWSTVRDVLKPILEGHIPKFAQNAKYDMEILERHGVRVQGLTCDTLIASYLLTPDGTHNLDQLSQTYLSHKTTSYEEVVGTGKKQINFSEVPVDQARDYSCEDADVTYRLVEILMPKLGAEKLESLYRDIELPLIPVLARMELNGVKVDVEKLKWDSQEYEKKLKYLEKEIFEKCGGHVFNLGSPKQLGDILFEKLKLPAIRKTKTGYSTDVAVLTELSKFHEAPRLILEHRSLAKLKSTYLDALVSMVNTETGRIHTCFNQTVAATGRLSSSEPNLQNIPIRTEDGKRIRESFVAEAGNKILSADYSQIELRILAHLSKDKILLEAFRENKDIHSLTASKIFNVKPSEVTPRLRSIGKTVNFAVLYGQGAFSLSQQLDIDLSEAETYIRNYFLEHQGVRALREGILEQARKEKTIRTLFGRLRRFPEIDSSNGNIRAMAERTAFNSVFQGTAADLIKKAMIHIHQRLQTDFPQAMMLIQVHDELVFEVPEKQVASVSHMVVTEMEKAAELAVPLKVETGVGNNWAEAH